MTRGTETPQPKDPNDTSGPTYGNEEPEPKVWCCEYHKMATNRASRRMADRWCPERKKP